VPFGLPRLKGGEAVTRGKIGAKIEVSILPSPRLLINLEPGLHVEFKSAVGVNMRANQR
jgi:hypothetical protein